MPSLLPDFFYWQSLFILFLDILFLSRIEHINKSVRTKSENGSESFGL